MKFFFFAFKHRYRFKDLNNFLQSRSYGKYFILNLGGPFKHLIAKLLMRLRIGTPISCDGRPLLKEDTGGFNFFIRGTSLNIPTDMRYLNNNIVSIKHPLLENKDVFQIYPINIKKTKVKNDIKIIFMSSVNIETNDKELEIWRIAKDSILSDFTLIDKIDFWKKYLFGKEVKIINTFYRKIKLLLRYEIVQHLKRKFNHKFIVIGNDWSKLSVQSMNSNYDIKQNNELYRGNICLDLGCIEGSSSLYSRANQIIEAGGLIIQSKQTDYKKKWKNLDEKILFKDFNHLDFIIQKMLNDYEYSNKILNDIYKNFSNSKILIEDSLDKINNN
jgi:hypothetical protein